MADLRDTTNWADATAEVTHLCARCGVPLTEAWPYAACEPCGKEPCLHGQTPGSCDACDVDADLAFDANREDRSW